MDKINIYGTGTNAIKFLLMNKNSIEVKAFIDGIKNKKTFMGEEGIPVLYPEDATDYLNKYPTVVATSPENYRQIRKRLIELGYEEFQHFIYWELYKKKVAICYGNCHMDCVANYLMLSKGFSAIYGIYPLPPICVMTQKGEDIEIYNQAFSKCDLLLHQSIRKENPYGEQYSSENILKNKLGKKCRTFGVPNLYRMAYFLFPQAGGYDDELIWEGNKFSFTDRYIDCYKNSSIQEIEDMMCDDGLIAKADIINARDSFIKKLSTRERDWDIKISEFIISNMQEEKLFYDMGHPTGKVVLKIVNSLLEVLGFPVLDRLIIPQWEMDTYELPLYAAVISALHLGYETKWIRLYNGAKLSNVAMDRTEYIRQYLAWVRR